MRKFAYITGFSIVGLASLLFISAWVLQLSGSHVRIQIGIFRPLLDLFAHPLPAHFGLRHKVPYYFYLSTVLNIALAILILRRIWLMAWTRSISPPPSYTGWLHFLMLFGLGFVALGLVGIVIALIYPMPFIGLILIPASFLLPPTVALVEFLSLLKKNSTHHDVVSDARGVA